MDEGFCRTNKCGKLAEYHVELREWTGKRYKTTRPSETWEGDFCKVHLFRCLTLKLSTLPPGLAVSIEKYYYEESHEGR